MATIGLWSLKAYHSVGLNATAPFGGRGDVYGVDLDDPIEPDGVLDSAAGDSVCAPSATVTAVHPDRSTANRTGLRLMDFSALSWLDDRRSGRAHAADALVSRFQPACTTAAARARHAEGGMHPVFLRAEAGPVRPRAGVDPRAGRIHRAAPGLW